jgi:ketosteroid isomerase-like protein
MTRTVVVRYQTRPEAAEENRRLIERVFAELHRDRPDGLRYTSLRLADGVSFVHVATSGDDHNPLGEVAAFAEFQREISARVLEPPLVSNATVVGSYGSPPVSSAVAVATAFIEAFGKHDLATVGELLAEDVVFESPRLRLEGAPAVLAAMTEFARTVTGVTIVDAFGDDDRAIIMYDLATGPFGTMRAADHLRVRDGRITFDSLVFDTHAMRP